MFGPSAEIEALKARLARLETQAPLMVEAGKEWAAERVRLVALMKQTNELALEALTLAKEAGDVAAASRKEMQAHIASLAEDLRKALTNARAE